MNEAKRIITEQCKVRHISINDLAGRIQLSKATFEKRLEEPDTFTIANINHLCCVLRLNADERAVLMCDEEYRRSEQLLR